MASSPMEGLTPPIPIPIPIPRPRPRPRPVENPPREPTPLVLNAGLTLPETDRDRYSTGDTSCPSTTDAMGISSPDLEVNTGGPGLPYSGGGALMMAPEPAPEPPRSGGGALMMPPEPAPEPPRSGGGALMMPPEPAPEPPRSGGGALKVAPVPAPELIGGSFCGWSSQSSTPEFDSVDSDPAFNDMKPPAGTSDCKIIDFLPRSTRSGSDLGSIPCSQWEKGEHIGRGSLGQVYRGFNRDDHGQFCAIKEVLVILNDPRSKKQLKQLNQEINVHKQLSHPNIVQYYGSIMTDRALSIYMEYLSEGSIHVLLAKHGPFKESRIRSYTAQILSGLVVLHKRRLIHRDIKGANILVGPNDKVKIADFGLAKHIETLTAVHTSCRGTPWWMAPEVILSSYSGEGYNESADIWSLGCTVIEMATGKPPLHGYGKIQAIFKIAHEKTYIPEIPDVLSDEGKDFVEQCLRRDRKARPSAAQLMDHPFIQNQGS